MALSDFGQAHPSRLVIVDDQVMVRAGLRMIVARQPDLVVVGEAADGMEAVLLCRDQRPDLVLMDVHMPGMDGLAAAAAIKRDNPKISILVVTMEADPDYLYEAVKAGVAGYVLKNAARSELADAIRRVLGGEAQLPSDVAMTLLRRLARQDRPIAPAAAPVTLAPREQDVLHLVARGMSNREIGEQLHLATGTIKNHVADIIAKLGVSDRTQAVVRGIEVGLIMPFES